MLHTNNTFLIKCDLEATFFVCKLSSALAVSALTSSRLMALGIQKASFRLLSLFQRFSVTVQNGIVERSKINPIFIYKYRGIFQGLNRQKLTVTTVTTVTARAKSSLQLCRAQR